MHSNFFFKTDKVNFEKTIGAAILDLFREKPSSKKALQEYMAMGAVLIWEDRMRREEGRGKVDQILFFKNKKEERRKTIFSLRRQKRP